MAIDERVLQENILREYPLPIAFEYQQLLVAIEESDRFGMYSQLAYLYEVIVRYLTSITMSILRVYIEDPSTNVVLAELDTFIQKNLDKPDLDFCIEILERTGRLFRTRTTPFMPELIRFLNSSDGIKKVGIRLILELLSLHNVVTHTENQSRFDRGRLQYVSEYEKYSKYVEELLIELNFLTKYPLIRLISTQEKFGAYELWKAQIFRSGQAVSEHNVIIRSIEAETIKVSSGWDVYPEYLGIFEARSQIFLSLYPYALFQVCNECQEEKREPFHDLFFYNYAYSNNAIYHAISDTSEQIPHKYLVSLNLVLDKFWPPSGKKDGYEDPDYFIRIQKDLEHKARQTIAVLREKYNADLYVHREEIEQQLQDFFNSNQPAFLIVGDSGTGKTNLILSVALQLLNQNHLVILQNLATWDSAAIEAGASSHLSSLLNLKRNINLIENLQNIRQYQETGESKYVYILLDAINESADPGLLIKSIDKDILLMLGDKSWIKLIISCRTESWKRLTTSLQNERFFFRSKDTIVHTLTKFSHKELIQAYKNYQWTYKLVSDFDDIPNQVIELIEYPLMLRLVAESYSETQIPNDLTLGDLFQKYDELKLGPLPGNNDTSPTQERMFIDYLIQEFMTKKSDKILWKILETSTDNRVRNWSRERYSLRSPYHKLLDIGVLLEVQRPVDNEVEIRFLFDQYLEYKLSQKLFPPDKDVNPEIFHEYLIEAQEFPSLFGALKSYLFTRNRGENTVDNDLLIFQLSKFDDIRIRGLLSDYLVALAKFSAGNYLQVKTLLEKMFNDANNAAGLLATLVAYLIKDVDLLILGVKSPYEDVRKQATIFAFSYWQTEQNAASLFMDRLNQLVKSEVQISNWPNIVIRAMSNPIKRRLFNSKPSLITGLEPLLDLSILMIPLAYRRPEAARLAGSVLMDLINRIPVAAKGIINFALSAYGPKIVMDTLSGGNASSPEGGWDIGNRTSEEQIMFTKWQEKALRWYSIKRPQDDPLRKLCAEALLYLHPDAGSLNDKLGDLVFTLAQEQDRFIYLSIVQILMTRVESYYEDLYRFAQRLYYQGNTHSQYLALRYFTLCTFLALGDAQCKPEHVEFADKMVFDFLSFPEKEVNYPGINGTIILKGARDMSHFGFSVLYEMHNRDHGELDVVKTFLDKPWPADRSLEKTEFIISGMNQAVLFSTALATPKVGLILESMMKWINNFDSLSDKERRLMMKSLAFYRSAFPNEVDLYLADAPAALKTGVHSYMEPITLPALGIIGMQAGIPWLHTYVPDIKEAFEKYLIKLALGENTLDEIASMGGKEITNLKTIERIAVGLIHAGL